MNTTYEKGLVLFQEEKYQDAMETFILAFEQMEKRDEILDLLFSCFWEPNFEELKKTYEESVSQISSIPFEDLKIIFFPISDELFYLYDSEQQKFIGSFDCSQTNYREKGMDFESVLITHCWDLREARKLVGETYPRCVFWLTNDENKTVSFLQLPGMLEKFWGNYLMMNSDALFKYYFEQMQDEYLPKKIISKEVDKYSDLLLSIHENRIKDMQKERNKIFLSICIPSFNRGEDAFVAVQEVLRSGYDEEIEVIVSNNGSTENVEGYQKIKDIKDNRVRYFEAEENVGFAGNIKKLIQLAKGEYVVFQSDQDRIVSSCLPLYLNELTRNGNIFAATSYGKGVNFPPPQFEGVIVDKKMVLNGVLNQNYLTGLFIHRQSIFDNGGMGLYEQLKDNSMVKFYTHIFFMLTAAKGKNIYISDQVLWIETGSVAGKAKDFVLSYIQPAVRMKQAEDAIEMLVKVTGVYDFDLIFLAEERYERVFDLLKVALYHYKEDFIQAGFDWKEGCEEIYQWGLTLIKPYKDYIFEDNLLIWKTRCREIYQNYLKQDVLKRKREV